MNESLLRALRRAGQALRDTWLMIGVVFLILGGIELAYRGQSNLRAALRPAKGAASVHSPYADSSWYPEYSRENTQTFREHWKPFVNFRRGPFAGSMINVDSAGHRRTIGNTVTAASTDTLRVFFFGGSTMWGTNQRDNATIASVAARQLAAAVPPGVAVDLTNFGESGYVFTQELIELELQLRSGNVPDLVLFYDGMCDMTAAAQNGFAGVSMNETNRTKEFEFGRAISGTENGAGSELRAAGAITRAVMERVQFVQRLFAIVAHPAPAPKSTEWLARDVARIYAGNVDIIEALSRAYGFKVVYVWQTTLYSTEKKLTLFEQDMIAAESHRSSLFGLLQKMNKVTAPALDSIMGRRVGARFVDETALFAGDTSSVFSDELGHTTEKAVPGIVGGFFPELRMLADSVRTSRALTKHARGD